MMDEKELESMSLRELEDAIAERFPDDDLIRDPDALGRLSSDISDEAERDLWCRRTQRYRDLLRDEEREEELRTEERQKHKREDFSDLWAHVESWTLGEVDNLWRVSTADLHRIAEVFKADDDYRRDHSDRVEQELLYRYFGSTTETASPENFFIVERKGHQNLWSDADSDARSMAGSQCSHEEILANQADCLGKEIVKEWLSAQDIVFSAKTDRNGYITLLDHTSIEVTTTVRTWTTYPRLWDECSVPSYVDGGPDCFLFVTLLRYESVRTPENIALYTHAILLGGTTRSRLDTIGIDRKTEEVNPKSRMKVWTVRKFVYVGQLDAPSFFVPNWR